MTPSSVTGMPKAVALLALAAVAFTGCSARTTQDTSPPRNVSPGDLVAVEGPAPVGHFYLKAGEKDLDSDLYEATFASNQFERLTTNSRVTTVDGCPDKVIVAAAQKSVGFTDHLQQLNGDKLAPVEALGLEQGSDPHVAVDCRILYVRLADSGPTPVQEVKLWDPARKMSSTVASGATVVSATWGPAGEIVVLHREPGGPRLVVQHLDTRPRSPRACPTWGMFSGAGADGWRWACADPSSPPPAPCSSTPPPGSAGRLTGGCRSHGRPTEANSSSPTPRRAPPSLS